VILLEQSPAAKKPQADRSTSPASRPAGTNTSPSASQPSPQNSAHALPVAIHRFLTEHPAGHAIAQHTGYGPGHPVHDAHEYAKSIVPPPGGMQIPSAAASPLLQQPPPPPMPQPQMGGGMPMPQHPMMGGPPSQMPGQMPG
jgi:hypothetical protein